MYPHKYKYVDFFVVSDRFWMYLRFLESTEVGLIAQTDYVNIK